MGKKKSAEDIESEVKSTEDSELIEVITLKKKKEASEDGLMKMKKHKFQSSTYADGLKPNISRKTAHEDVEPTQEIKPKKNKKIPEDEFTEQIKMENEEMQSLDFGSTKKTKLKKKKAVEDVDSSKEIKLKKQKKLSSEPAESSVEIKSKNNRKQIVLDTEYTEETKSNDQMNENYYVFDSSLKSIFQNTDSSSLSIRQHFLLDPEKTERKSIEVKTDDAKPEQFNVDNFKHDDPREPSQKIRSWKEHFFFLPNDPRLSEGIVFFKSPENHNSNKFTEMRKSLKYLVRHKVSKNKTLKIKRKLGKKKWKKSINSKVK